MKLTQENLFVYFSQPFDNKRANEAADILYGYLLGMPTTFGDGQKADIHVDITAHKRAESHRVDYFQLLFYLPPSAAYCHKIAWRAYVLNPALPDMHQLLEQIYMYHYADRFFFLLSRLKKARNCDLDKAIEKTQLFAKKWKEEIVGKDFSKHNVLFALKMFQQNFCAEEKFYRECFSAISYFLASPQNAPAIGQISDCLGRSNVYSLHQQKKERVLI